MTTASTTRHVLFFPLLLLALFVSGCLELATASSLHDTSDTPQQQQRRVDDSSPKRLIIAVGPRKAGTTDVAKFFYTHASSSSDNNNNNNNNNNENKKKVGLNGWIWPTFQDQEDVDPNGLIPPEMHPYDIFRVYMNQPHNDPLIEVLDTGLKKAWETSTAGIIIASPFFDRVDDDIIFDNNNNNNNSENPTSAGPLLARIIHDVLQIPNPEQQVTIVINYRTPRLDQWVSLFKHQKSRTAATTTNGSGTGAVDLKYVNFMCQDEYSDIRRHLVETSMNPLGIANFFIERYQYNVVLVDLEGAGAEDVAIGHAILCNVLEYCDTSLNADFEEDVSETHGAFSTLDDQKQLQLEQLFLERDCYYRSKLLKGNNGNNGDYIDKFKALYPTNLWRGCLDGHISSYEKLTNPDTLVKALQSQKNCDHKLKKGYASGLLVGDIHTMMDNSSSNGGSSSSSSSGGGSGGGGGGTTEDHETHNEEPEAANGETNIEDTDDETDDDDNVDLSVLEQDDDDKAEPDIEGAGDESNNQIDPDILEEEPLLVEKKSTKEDAPFLTLMFFLVAIGAGAYQLKMMHPPPRQQRQQGGNNNNGLGPGALEFANTGSSSNGGSNYRDEGNYRDDDGEDEGDFI